MTRNLAAGVLLTLLLGAAAGCGSSGGTSAPQSDGVSHVADASSRGDLPDSFPLPPGVKIINSVRTGPRISVTVRLSDSAAACRFWTEQLPATGYKIFSQQPFTDPDHALLQFTGNGWAHGTLAVNADVAAIVMTK